jgi:hypothetical protein
MLRLVSDENAKGPVVNGLLLHGPGLDLVRVVDVGLGGASDERILDWAATEGRVALTSERNTLIGFARQRQKNRQPMPGVFALTGSGTVRETIDDVLMAANCYSEEEMTVLGVIYIPVR